jgi:hypothetical protein
LRAALQQSSNQHQTHGGWRPEFEVVPTRVSSAIATGCISALPEGLLAVACFQCERRPRARPSAADIFDDRFLPPLDGRLIN